MKLIAAPGLKVPREDNPRTYITSEEAVEVEMTGYYVRRMADGDLLEAAPAPAPAAEKGKAKA
jgi:hypothetical protein